MTTARLPQVLKPLFWDYPAAKLSWRADRDLIIRRVLANGSWDAILWLRKKMGDDALRTWILQHDGRGLGPRQVRFWELMLDLPRRKTNQWVRRAQENPWVRRGVRFETDTAAAGTLHGTVNTIRTTFLEYRYPLLNPQSRLVGTGLFRRGGKRTNAGHALGC